MIKYMETKDLNLARIDRGRMRKRRRREGDSNHAPKDSPQLLSPSFCRPFAKLFRSLRRYSPKN
jgi:hypothetical protein